MECLSPCRQRAFARELTSWIERSGFSQAVLMSSVDAGLRTDKHLQSFPVCVTCQHSPAAEGSLQDVPQAPSVDLGAKAVEERHVAPWCAFCRCFFPAL